MPRVTVDDMVRAVREADKPLTASGIADATGVTQQAISARRGELEADERIEYGQVGNARAYWIADRQEDRTAQPGPPGGYESDDLDHPKDDLTQPGSGSTDSDRGQNDENGGFLGRIFSSSRDGSMDLPTAMIILTVIGVFGFVAIRLANSYLTAFGEGEVIQNGDIHISQRSLVALVLSGATFLTLMAAVAWFVAIPALAHAFAQGAIFGLFTSLAIFPTSWVLGAVSTFAGFQSVKLFSGGATA